MKKRRVLAGFLALAMSLGSVAVSAPVHAANTDTATRVQSMIDEMSVRDKVTQMLMVDFRMWDSDLTDATEAQDFTVMNEQVQKIVEDYNFGALIYFSNNLVTTEQSYNLTMAMQEAATKDGGIPMIISADQEGGSVYRLGTGTALPGNMALGATGSTEYAKAAGEIIGSELASLGINTTLAPVVDVNNNANNPVIGLRSYGDDATSVGTLASATIAGLAEHNVIGCAKHFPGHGDTATDSHTGLPIVDKSLDVLKEVELKPYEVAIEQGIEMIMTAHILYPQLETDTIVSEKTGEAESLPATMSDDILTGLLKEEMGFEGIIVTDAMNMAGISDKWNQVQSVKIAIAAGVDMICMPCTLYDTGDLEDLDAIIDGVVAAVNDNEIPESRLDDACTRILTVKANRGILDYDAADYSLANAIATVGSDENRATEREIAAAAVTVVQNKDNTLPLDITENSKVLMLVPYNNERGQMIMGWNRAKEAGIIPEDAEVDVVRFTSTGITEEIQEKLDWADTYIINSEISSASRFISNHWLYKVVTDLVNQGEANNKTTVVMSVDKPYDVQMYPQADAVLATYGCKGSSVDPTEALIGGSTSSNAAYGPNIIAGIEVALGTFGASGKLPVNIPEFDTNATSASDAYGTDIAFARGYGITYDAVEAKYEVSDKVKVDVYEDMVQKVYTDEQGNTMPYRLYVPENYDADKDYPVLVFLHGAGERGTDNTSQLANAIQLMFYTQEELADAIVIAPQCPIDNRWVETDWTLGNYDSEAIQEEQLKHVMGILAEVQQGYSTDTDRIYAVGLSMGGFGTWDLLTRHSDVFAAGVPICGSGDPAKADVLKDIPIWTFHGTADAVVPYAGTENMVNAITAAGGTNIQFTTYEGSGHGIWDDAVKTEGLGEWLFAQRLSDRIVDKTAAQEYYDDCLTYYKEAEYTAESWKAFQAAMDKLKAALEAEDITTEELQSAVDNVANNLPVKKQVTNPETDEPEDTTSETDEPEDTTSETDEPEDTTSETDEVVQTGDTVTMMPFVIMAGVAAAIAGTVVVNRKRR